MLNPDAVLRSVLQKVEEEKRNGGKPPPETKPYFVTIEDALNPINNTQRRNNA